MESKALPAAGQVLFTMGSNRPDRVDAKPPILPQDRRLRGRLRHAVGPGRVASDEPSTPSIEAAVFAAFRYPSDRELLALVALGFAALVGPPLIGAALGARRAGSTPRYMWALALGIWVGVIAAWKTARALYGWDSGSAPGWIIPWALAAGALASYAVARLVADHPPPGITKATGPPPD